MMKKKKKGVKPAALRSKKTAKKRTAAKRAPAKRAKARKKATVRKAPVRKAPARKKTARKTRPGSASRRPRGRAASSFDAPLEERGLGAEAGGQSGDTEGVSRKELADSESVEELLEEGQAFEAGVISGVENARDPDKGEVRTREVPEDDVPQEYLDKD